MTIATERGAHFLSQVYYKPIYLATFGGGKIKIG